MAETYRIETLPDGYEPQMKTTDGRGDELWAPLNPDGYWLDPKVYSTGVVVQRGPLETVAAAEMAIWRARKINRAPLGAGRTATRPRDEGGLDVREDRMRPDRSRL